MHGRRYSCSIAAHCILRGVLVQLLTEEFMPTQVMSVDRHMLRDQKSAAEQLHKLQQQIKQLQSKLAEPLAPWVSPVASLHENTCLCRTKGQCMLAIDSLPSGSRGTMRDGLIDSFPLTAEAHCMLATNKQLTCGCCYCAAC